MSPASLRPVLEAPCRRTAHRVHETQAFGYKPGGVLRGAGARVARTRCHPARSEPLQTHFQKGFRSVVQRLYQCKVRLVNNFFFLLQV